MPVAAFASRCCPRAHPARACARHRYPAEQPLLPVDHVRIHRTALQRLRELRRFLGQLLGSPGLVLIAHLVQRRGDVALLATAGAPARAPLIELRTRPG